MKKDKKPAPNTRRRFLALAAMAVAATKVSGKTAQQTGDDAETVKMLTPDGKLVEVPKAVLEQASNRKKASNKDLLDWRISPENNQ